MIEVRLLSQIWILKRRFRDFEKMHKRLLADLDFIASENMPDLPPKRMFNKGVNFIVDRQKNLNRYLKFIILIYEAISSPILQRFLEIDTRFNPSAEYQYIDPEESHSATDDCSSLFLEMDKFMKVRLQYVMKNQTGPLNFGQGITLNFVNCT